MSYMLESKYSFVQLEGCILSAYMYYSMQTIQMSDTANEMKARLGEGCVQYQMVATVKIQGSQAAELADAGR